MGLFDAIRSALNGGMAPQNMPQQGAQQPSMNPAALANNSLPANGLFNTILGLADTALQFQPQYMQIAQDREKLANARIENQNAPLYNAIRNQLLQQQANLAGAQAQYMPVKLNMQGRRLDIDERRYSPEQLQSMLLKRQSEIATAPQRALSADGKRIVERQQLDAGYAPAGNTWDQQTGNLAALQQAQGQPLPLSAQQVNNLKTLFPQAQQPTTLTSAIANQAQGMQQPAMAQQPDMAQQQAQPVVTDAGDFMDPKYANNANLLQYDLQTNKKLVPTQTLQQFSAARQLEGFANDPNVRKSLLAFSQYAGLYGRGQEYLDSLKRTKPELYQQAMEAKKVTLTNLANLERRLENLGVQESTREEIRGSLDGAKDMLTSDPQTALYLINAALRQMNAVTKQVYATAQPARKIYSPHPFRELSMSELNQQEPSAQGTGNFSVQDLLQMARG